MRTLILGDIHRRWGTVHDIIAHELRPGDAALCTGDLQTYAYDPPIPVPLYFIGGNHDHRWSLESLLQQPTGLLRPMLPGRIYDVGGLRAAGLSGVFSPHFFPEPRADTALSKYFTQDDITQFRKLKSGDIDVLLTHEAPQGIPLPAPIEGSGNAWISTLLDWMNPAFNFIGHHHLHYESRYGHTRTILLDKPHRSYAILEDGLLRVETARLAGRAEGYQYAWT